MGDECWRPLQAENYATAQQETLLAWMTKKIFQACNAGTPKDLFIRLSTFCRPNGFVNRWSGSTVRRQRKGNGHRAGHSFMYVASAERSDDMNTNV